MDTQLMTQVLAQHQKRSIGMSAGTPDECRCGARTLPEPGEDEITVRRDRAFAAHQADMLAEAEGAAEADQTQDLTSAAPSLFDHFGGYYSAILGGAEVARFAPSNHWSDYARDMETRDSGFSFAWVSNPIH